MKLKFSCAWLYAISKYNKYAENFKLKDVLITLNQIKKIGFDTTELEVMRKRNFEEMYENKKIILENLDKLNCGKIILKFLIY